MYNFFISAINAAELKITWSLFNRIDNVIMHTEWEKDIALAVKWLEKCKEEDLHLDKLKEKKYADVWSSLDYRNKFRNNNPMCFVFFSRDTYYANKYVWKILKNSYADAKFVMIFTDMVDKHPYYNIRDIKERFDMVLTTVDDDVERYGLLYYPYVYTEPDKEDICAEYESDILFVGHTKDRLEKLESIYEYLSKRGVKCEFHIIAVPEDQQRYKGKIHYEPQNIMYSEVIERVKRTKCILDVKQSDDPTSIQPRPLEAIIYRKKLLTNEPNFKRVAKYDNPKYVKIFRDESEIAADWLKEEIEIDYKYQEEFSPLHLLKWISECLERKTVILPKWIDVFDKGYLSKLGFKEGKI